MARSADTYAEEEIVRRPGDFRRSKAGTPYVAHPTDTAKHAGTKAELAALCAERCIAVPDKVTVAQLVELLGPRPKWVPYGRPSSFGKQIEDTYNLAKWSERTVALGLAIDFAQACEMATNPVLLSEALALVDADRDTPEWRSAADAIVVEAKRIAKAGLAAERGTHGHALTEEDDSERDWIALAESGEVLGLDVGVQQSLVEAWRAMLARDGIVILATEMPMVHDPWRKAGTLDRIGLLTRTLRFSLATGEVVELAAGTYVVLDIKTGKRRTDRNGVVMYWQTYAVQIATYAGGCCYDVDTDQRSPYPWPVDQNYALIAHLDVLGAIDGNPACTLVLVDIAAGRDVAERLVLPAVEWEKRTDVFSVAQLETGLLDAPIASSAEANLTPPVVEDAAPVPAPDRAPGQPCLPDPVDQLAALSDAPAEGGPADEAAFDLLEAAYNALEPDQRDAIHACLHEAMNHRVSFHGRGHRTVRRFELIRALVRLGQAGALGDPDAVRGVLALVLGDVAHFPAVTIGHAVGSLGHADAATFARHCDDLAEGLLIATVHHDGRISLQRAA